MISKFTVHTAVLGKSLESTIGLLAFHKIVLLESSKTTKALGLNNLLEKKMQPAYYLLMYILAPAALVI